MRPQSKSILALTIAFYAVDANADGTATALLEAAFYVYLMPIFLAIPLLLISLTDKSSKTRKTPWIIASLILGVCSFYVPIWINNRLWNYDIVALIPLLIQATPSYLLLLAFWIVDAKSEQ